MNSPQIAWIYSLSDYQQIFNLTPQDLSRSILDFPGGLSSFNAQMHARGLAVLSADQLYATDAQAMPAKAQALLKESQAFLQQYLSVLESANSETLETITQIWQQSAHHFAKDYAQGLAQGRYQSAWLPRLSYADHQFELALCTDLVFHSQTQQTGNDLVLINELLRVAQEVRVFPLLDEKGNITESLGQVMLHLQQQGHYGIEVAEVPYQILKGGNAMLRLWANACSVTEP